MDIGLYIHVPFCATRCGYCDFYSTVPKAGAFDPLVDALLLELETSVVSRNVRIDSIFAGGGTPTLLPLAALRKLFAGLGRLTVESRASVAVPLDTRRSGAAQGRRGDRHESRVPAQPGAAGSQALQAEPEADGSLETGLEFTVEANPASLSDSKAAVLRESGVNRISMGAQSFHAHELRALDRIHSPADIAPSAEIIHRAGFEHFNLDLIFGIPGQTPASLGESIRRAIDLGPDHLACYGLTYEPDTPLRDKLDSGFIAPMDEDLETDLYLMMVECLADAGFRQYEISNFARPGAECRHNLRYWHNLPGLGIGPSAASYFEGRRWRNVPDTAEYVRRLRAGQDVAIDVERLDPVQRAGETAMLELRLVEGIRCHEFKRATGFDPGTLFSDAIARHVAAGLLFAESGRIALTPRGRLLANSVISDFLAPGWRSADTDSFQACRVRSVGC